MGIQNTIRSDATDAKRDPQTNKMQKGTCKQTNPGSHANKPDATDAGSHANKPDATDANGDGTSTPNDGGYDSDGTVRRSSYVNNLLVNWLLLCPLLSM